MNHVVTDDLLAHPTTMPIRTCTIGAVIGVDGDCAPRAQAGRIYVSTTIRHLGRARFVEYLKAPPLRRLEHIDVYDVASERDYDVTFVNELEVSQPFRQPGTPAWDHGATFAPVRVAFGFLDAGVLVGERARTCVLVRSQPIAGDVLLGADDTLVVFDDHGGVLAYDQMPSGVDWPQMRLHFAKPQRLRLMLCNITGDFAVQMAVR
jgi:hypothetical protein